MSRGLLYPHAAVAEMIAARTGREPFLTLDGLAHGQEPDVLHQREGRRASSASVARPYAEGLRDAIDWFREAGYLR